LIGTQPGRPEGGLTAPKDGTNGDFTLSVDRAVIMCYEQDMRIAKVLALLRKVDDDYLVDILRRHRLLRRWNEFKRKFYGS